VYFAGPLAIRPCGTILRRLPNRHLRWIACRCRACVTVINAKKQGVFLSKKCKELQTPGTREARARAGPTRALLEWGHENLSRTATPPPTRSPTAHSAARFVRVPPRRGGTVPSERLQNGNPAREKRLFLFRSEAVPRGRGEREEQP
jgi:hypothetical protein